MDLGLAGLALPSCGRYGGERTQLNGSLAHTTALGPVMDSKAVQEQLLQKRPVAPGHAAHHLREPLLARFLGPVRARAPLIRRCDSGFAQQRPFANNQGFREQQLAGLGRHKSGLERCDREHLVAERNASVQISQAARDFVAPLPRNSLVIALRNLIENALLHGPANSEVRVDSDGTGFCVRDAGPGLSDSASRAMLEPFTRDPGSKAPGSGLGLSIVSSALAPAMRLHFERIAGGYRVCVLPAETQVLPEEVATDASEFA